MSGAEAAPTADDDRSVVRNCVHNPSQRAWEVFFRQFEARFKKWIRNNLRDGSEADREDLHQIFAEKLLSGKVLPLLDSEKIQFRIFIRRCGILLAGSIDWWCARRRNLSMATLWLAAVERLGKRIKTKDGSGYIAAPFYQNISVLARHNERMQLAAGMINSSAVEIDKLSGREAWSHLQELAKGWESQGQEYWFFSCPFAQPETVETYNCLFFEILLTFKKPSEGDCQLTDWLRLPEAKTAAHIFRDLCYRSHRHERDYFQQRANKSEGETLRVFSKEFDSNEYGPVFWRHWYNTLSEMMWDLPASEPSAISVKPLPDNVTSAGEWYLAVPAHSAAPELAWQIIQMLTSPDRELQRIYHGVGLPTRESYYQHSTPTTPASLVSPFFHIPRTLLRSLVDGAFQRSTFPCYQKMTETISGHLQRILELPASAGRDAESIEPQADAVIDHLLESLEYIRDSTVCENCHEKGGWEFVHKLYRPRAAMRQKFGAHPEELVNLWRSSSALVAHRAR